MPMPTDWIAKSLSRKLTLGLVIIMSVASLVFLAVLTVLYYGQLKKERAIASTQINLLLQASLENAMLKRDLSGLAQIVDRLGRQESVRRVMIINPGREVRFASDRKLLYKVLKAGELSGCTDCSDKADLPRKLTHFMMDGPNEDILRSVNPIFNRPPCTVCHGPRKDKPVNGLLIVDYEAGGIARKALLTAGVLALAGASIVLLAILAVWLFLRRAVVGPVAALSRASSAITAGDLSVRVDCQRQDELSKLCHSFNAMAEQLGRYLGDLQANEKFMQELIDAIPDGIRVIDEDFRIIMANKAYCRQQHIEMADVGGSPCHLSSHGRNTPCPPSLMTCPLFEVRKSGRPVKLQHHHQRQGGELFHVEVSAAPLVVKRQGKNCFYVVESIRDLEKQIKVTQEQRLSELGKLAAGVAHEIHNPLASVRIGLQSLMNSASREQADEEFRDYLRMVDGEVDKCIEVTRRLLHLSLAPSDFEQLVSLCEIIPEVVSLLRYEAEKNGIELNMDVRQNELRVLATDSEMRMVVLNLVQNAFHAMPDGGRLDIVGLADDEEICVSFTDNGVGIAPRDMKYIFDPFFSRRADEISGTGLGLTIAKSIVERFHGRLEVRSEVGKGTVFTLFLPNAGEGDRP